MVKRFSEFAADARVGVLGQFHQVPEQFGSIPLPAGFQRCQAQRNLGRLQQRSQQRVVRAVFLERRGQERDLLGRVFVLTSPDALHETADLFVHARLVATVIHPSTAAKEKGQATRRSRLHAVRS